MANIVSMQFANNALNELCSSPVPSSWSVQTSKQSGWTAKKQAMKISSFHATFLDPLSLLSSCLGKLTLQEPQDKSLSGKVGPIPTHTRGFTAWEVFYSVTTYF